MAEDRYETYFAEKIWAMIPEVYRHEDGLAEHPGVLRALVEVLARQAAVVRRSHDRLWEDQFIELCDDWAVPYIGDLVGTRLVSALNLRGRRVDVAKTIYYRRRQGTLAVLEELIGDIAGWEGTAVEQFQRLSRAPHRLDPPVGTRVGRVTGTPPGGLADLRNVRGCKLAGEPFDEYHYTPDVRRHRGRNGRYAIPKIAFHLYRLRAYEVMGVNPAVPAGIETPGDERGRYTFDPSGRDVPLFMPRSRPQDPATPTAPGQWEQWRPAREWELPAPMPCRLLTKSRREREDDNAPPTEARQHLLWRAIALEVGARDVPLQRSETTAARLDGWTTSASDALVIEPERGRFLLEGNPSPEGIRTRYAYGFSGPIGAGPYARPHVEERVPDRPSLSGGGTLSATAILNDGVTQISDSATYVVTGDKTRVKNLILQAANYQRPYLRVAYAPGEVNLVLNTGTLDAGGVEDAKLELDGLWIGGDPDAPSEQEQAVILRGDYERVTLRHMTLDPGGEARLDVNESESTPIRPVPLRIEASVELLEIESSIIGPIAVTNGGSIEQLRIRDSILQSQDEDEHAVVAGSGEVILERVTVLGALDVRRLWASEALITGPIDIDDIQKGCFRFGAARTGFLLPHPYETHRFEQSGLFFVSRRFGDPGFAQLTQAAPLEIRRGAESGSEIGAFSGLLSPIKQESLQAKVEEYLPFGRIPIYVFET